MHKIIFQVGLLIFFVSVIFFSQKGMAIQDIFIRSTIIFLVFTIMLSLLTLLFVKSINKAALAKRKQYLENIGRN